MEENEKNILYYSVIYLKDNTIHLWPGKTKEECEATNKKIIKKYKDKIKTTKIIKRNLNNYVDGLIL